MANITARELWHCLNRFSRCFNGLFRCLQVTGCLELRTVILKMFDNFLTICKYFEAVVTRDPILSFVHSDSMERKMGLQSVFTAERGVTMDTEVWVVFRVSFSMFAELFVVLQKKTATDFIAAIPD